MTTSKYVSSWEVVCEALRDWTHKRSLHQQGVAELRATWQQALSDERPGVGADEVLDRLERKYQAIVDAAGGLAHVQSELLMSGMSGDKLARSST